MTLMKQVDFENGTVASHLARTALPMLAAQIIQLLYSIVDRIYIGRIPDVGTQALGGVGLSFPLVILIAAFTNLFGSGGSPLCAIARGEGKREKAERVMNTAFVLLSCTAVILTVVCQILAVPMLRLFGASDQNLPFALSYLRIYLLGTLFSMLASGLNPYIVAQGYAATGMFTVVIGAVANIVLDPLLIFVFHMGVQGAAFATVISQGLSALFALYFLIGSKAELRLRRFRLSTLRENKDTAISIVSLGASAFVMQFTNALASVSCNSVLSHFGGDIYVSVMTIISSVRQILETPILSIAEGGSPIISFNYGARRPKRVWEAIRFVTIVALGYTCLIWLLIQLFPTFFIGIFTSDPVLIEKAVPAMHIYYFAFVFQALQYSGQTTFKALNRRREAIFFSLLRKVVLVIPFTFIFPYVFGFGANGVFMAEPLSNIIGGSACFITMLLRIRPELKEMEKCDRGDGSF